MNPTFQIIDSLKHSDKYYKNFEIAKLSRPGEHFPEQVFKASFSYSFKIIKNLKFFGVNIFNTIF